MRIVAYALLVICVLFIRQPTSFRSPQLYAEDGTWLEQAYNGEPIRSLIIPDGGYLQILERIPAVIATFFP